MGRGRGRGHGFGARLRPPAPFASTDVSAEIEAIRAQVPARCRAEAEAILAGAANHELPLARTMVRAGGVAGDDKGSAGDLAEAADWYAAAGTPEDLARARELLQRALAHQAAHRRRLAEAKAKPRSSRNFGFLRGLGRGGLDTMIHDAERLEGRLQTALESGQDESAGFRRWLALGELVAEPLRRLLLAGEVARVRALALGVLALGDDAKSVAQLEAISDAELVRAGRLLAAKQILGTEDSPGDLLLELARRGTSGWTEAIGPRLAGDEEEQMLEDAGVYLLGHWVEHRSASIYQGERALLDPVTRGEQVMLRAAGLLRTPRRYERVSHGGPAPELRGRLVRVQATPEAFREFCAEQRDNPAFCGYALTNRGGELELVARMAVRSGGDDIELRCVLPLGHSSRRVLRTLTEDALAHADWPAGLVDPTELTLVETPDNAPVSRPHRFTAEEARDRLRAGVDTILGRPACAHPDGRWVPVGRDGQGERVREPDGIALECPTCLRRRVAVLPLLSVPADDPRRPALEVTPDHAHLLRREHAYRALRGEPALSDAEMTAELAARTPASLDPARWASVAPEPADSGLRRPRSSFLGAR